MAERVSAISGAILLVLSLALVYALPVTETLPPLYRVSFGSETGDIPGGTIHSANPPEESRIQELYFDMPVDNVFEVTVHYRFTDDVAASMPDQFILQLFKPGRDSLESIPPLHVVSNRLATEDPDQPGTFVPVEVNNTYTWSLEAPASDYVHAPPTEENVSAIEADVLAKRSRATAGQWMLKVTFQPGGCPDALEAIQSGSDVEVRRAVACAGEASDPATPGPPQDIANPITIESFKYRKFTVHAERIQ